MASAPSSKRQEEHYEAIHDDYARHYYDRGSTAYRNRFINSALFDGLALDGCRVAEIMCGDGPLTAYLRSRDEAIEIEGFDISPKACEAYEKATGCPATVVDITASPLPVERFDVIAVSGGLHHVAHHLDATLRNIHRALKPGGRLAIIDAKTDPGEARSRYHNRHRIPAELVREDARRNGFRFLHNQPRFVHHRQNREFYLLVFEKPGT